MGGRKMKLSAKLLLASIATAPLSKSSACPLTGAPCLASLPAPIRGRDDKRVLDKNIAT